MSEEIRTFKGQIYEQFARIGKALASPTRLELLDLLCQGERTVNVLAEAANLSIANTSQHLRVLNAARLVKARKKGVFVTYQLADDTVCEFWHSLRSLAEQRLAELTQVVRDFFEKREELEPVDRFELLDRLRKGMVTLIDVRPEEEYRAAHISGALSMPLDKLTQCLSGLPTDREIVAYCRGPYCVLSIEAMETLRNRGYKVRRLKDGIPEWRTHGLPVAVGESPGKL